MNSYRTWRSTGDTYLKVDKITKRECDMKGQELEPQAKPLKDYF